MTCMNVKELKDILRKYENDDSIHIFCSNNEAELVIYRGKRKLTKEVIMKTHDLWHHSY